MQSRALQVQLKEEKPFKPMCFIPARRGSKRLPNKHKLEINGKPLILYTIEAALKSNLFEAVIVTSDDEELLAIAYGAALGRKSNLRLHRRPRELCGNRVQLRQVARAMLNIFKVERCFCLMPPDNPFVTAEDLISGYKLFQEKEANYVMSMVQSRIPLERAIKVKRGFLEPKLGLKRSQAYKPAYYHDSSFIFANPLVFSVEYEYGFYGSKNVPYIVPHTSVDIDTFEDYLYAKWILEREVGSKQ